MDKRVYKPQIELVKKTTALKAFTFGKNKPRNTAISSFDFYSIPIE